MNNTHIFSTSPNTTFGINFPEEHSHHFNQNYEEINERLFDTYLEISGRKNNNNLFEPTKSLSSTCSADVSSADEESDSSYHKVSSMNTSHHQHKYAASRKSKTHKKQDSIDSDNDSLHEFSTTTVKSKKSIKSIVRKSSSTSSVTSESAGNDKKQKSLYKTELCRNWEETGHCRYGMKCQYAHGAADLREIDRHPKYKTQKCRTFHQTGACPYGARCTFRHFNLPGDALEMKNIEKQEEEEKRQQQLKQQQKEVISLDRPTSVFSSQQQQSWFLGNQSPLAGLGQTPKMNITTTSFDAEDSLLPSNAESLLPHQLLFDLESPDEDEERVPRCPLRNYVNLPSFSHFQGAPSSYHHQIHQQQQQEQHEINQAQQCKTFFRPWLF